MYLCTWGDGGGEMLWKVGVVCFSKNILFFKDPL